MHALYTVLSKKCLTNPRPAVNLPVQISKLCILHVFMTTSQSRSVKPVYIGRIFSIFANRGSKLWGKMGYRRGGECK